MNYACLSLLSGSREKCKFEILRTMIGSNTCQLFLLWANFDYTILQSKVDGKCWPCDKGHESDNMANSWYESGKFDLYEKNLYITGKKECPSHWPDNPPKSIDREYFLKGFLMSLIIPPRLWVFSMYNYRII